MADDLVDRRRILTERWMAEKIANIDEVTLPDGRIKYNLQVRDAGRIKPFIDQVFKHYEQAEDFLHNKLMKEVQRIGR